MEISLEAAKVRAKADFAALDPVAVAGNAGASLAGPGLLRLTYFGRPVVVHHPGGEVEVEDGQPLPEREQVLLLHYLCRASGAPPEKQWISFSEVPGGSLYVGPFRQRCLVPFLRRFGTDPAALAAAAAALGAEPLALGDSAYALAAVPKVFLAFVLWLGDAEFPPNASILFDRSVRDYLPAEDCVVLAQTAVKYLILAVQS